jgi:drug/metabolite transporter superfamily protein YnfA
VVGFLREFWQFLRVRKKFWLLPIMIMLIVFGGLLVLVQGTAVAPFVYTIF